MTANTPKFAPGWSSPTARQKADIMHKRRLVQRGRLEPYLSGSFNASALDDPTLRATVASLSGNGSAHVLLHDWVQRMTGEDFDLSYLGPQCRCTWTTTSRTGNASPSSD